jgi:hypothetical protein
LPPVAHVDIGLLDEPPVPVACRRVRAASANSGVNVVYPAVHHQVIDRDAPLSASLG